VGFDARATAMLEVRVRLSITAAAHPRHSRLPVRLRPGVHEVSQLRALLAEEVTGPKGV